MLEINRRLWFRTIMITFDDERVPEICSSGSYDSITALSYNDLNLPKFRQKRKDTSLIDLTASEEDIFKRMKPTTRNEIRRTFGNSMLSFQGPVPLTSDVYELYASFESAQGRTPIRRKEAEAYEYFVARVNDSPISAISVRSALPYLRIRSIFSKRLTSEDRESIRNISNASRRLVWDICRWGKENGFVSLDLASVNLHETKKAGITQFKLSFGGNITPEYTYIYKSPAFRMFEWLATIRLWINRLRSALKR